MINEDYVSFEVAKLLKEKGFDEPVMHHFTPDGTQRKFQQAFYRDDVAQPTLQMAMKWLRKNHSIFIATEFGWFHGDYEYQASVVKMNPTIPPTLDSIEYIKAFRNKSYEIACESSIKYCLTNLIK